MSLSSSLQGQGGRHLLLHAQALLGEHGPRKEGWILVEHLLCAGHGGGTLHP